MKFNVAYLLMAVVILAIWGLRRLGVDDTTTDTVLTLLAIGLGLTPAPGQVPGVPKLESRVEVTKVDP